MEVLLKQEVIDKLSHAGIMAYVAVALAGDVETTTAVLATSVRVTPALMRDGLQELSVEAPEMVRQAKSRRWLCGRCGDPGVNGGVIAFTTSERYAGFVDDLKKYWDHLNPKIPFAMDGKDGAAIRRWLAGHPNWEQEHWRQALNNRAKSVIVKSAPFYTWISKLSEHAAEPLNEYNKPREGTGKHGQAASVEEATRSAREQFLATIGKRRKG